ncbi:Transcriptional regulator, RHH [Saccharolobus shibatae B12]|uniref:Transcriptional regulator, RHH n=1 Tax=Saccharolobus shibatae (strain ATCC 51178 / DSM 5389 / JCM 8931 / NBRC 15437 / B12) TaxID=523848 RepID=A0A8F5BQF5_SACSH|nr:hypothetical protein [Saccharolobus shibatae]QXJ29554.1 Transcriptional regulator, RHH [Saccharolobus shibatae B12]
MNEKLFTLLDETAKEYGISKSQIIREGIVKELAEIREVKRQSHH